MRGQQSTLVETAMVKNGNVAKTIVVTGAISARAEVEVYPKQSGEIIKLLVDMGDRVKAGQVLANIETRTFELQAKQADADLASAKAAYDKSSSTALVNSEAVFKQAKSNLDRVQSALKQADLDLQLQTKQADAQIKKASSDLRIAQARLDAAVSGARKQEIEQAKARKDNAKRNLDRLKALLNDGMIPQDQVESAQLQYDVYSAQLSLLEEGTRPEDIEVLKEQVEAAKTALGSAQDNKLLIDIKSASLDSAKAQLESAQASFEQANVAKDSATWEKELAQADAAVKRAKAALELAQQRLDESTVKAPISGTIAQRFLDKGDIASPTRPFVTIVDIDVVKVIAKVPEREIGSIRIGQKASVKPDAYPGQAFPGTLTKISPIIDRTSQTCDIEIEVPNPDQKLKPGMFVRAELIVSESKVALVVPVDAIVKEGEETFVYVAEGDKAVKKKVETGISDSIKTEIVSGLKAGDQYIVTGQSSLKDGTPIMIPGEKKGRGEGPPGERSKR